MTKSKQVNQNDNANKQEVVDGKIEGAKYMPEPICVKKLLAAPLGTYEKGDFWDKYGYPLFLLAAFIISAGLLMMLPESSQKKRSLPRMQDL
eukprot:CAMPEP_0171321808 /NCGR_PEP_ID=MMETSP0816-20121228/114571_1 /TAXON_ID=420281 /ORGANISM="Proboscia inermis, Strain CCAP1064/1" /LENGTH=91 /DNA_ID=CAMNT_0011820143 /DNA_START=55 /DNA_END=330 /DNA_ORIENTATION=+